jgi:fatty acid desaturase
VAEQSTGNRRGYLDPQRVIAVAFWVVAASIVVAVLAAVLAIWQFTGTDALWRTVATCVVVGAGAVVFAWLNMFFGDYRHESGASAVDAARRASVSTPGDR